MALPHDATGENPIRRMLYPSTVADVVTPRQPAFGRLRLELQRTDGPGVEAVIAALVAAGGSIEPRRAADSSLIVTYDHRVTDERRLLAAPLPSLPPPTARVDSTVSIAAPVERAWAAFATGDGPPWRPPAMVEVEPLAGDPPSWAVVVAAGPWRLPHHVTVTSAHPPHELEVTVSGKLNAVVRYQFEGGANDDTCNFRQRMWFALGGTAIEAAVGGALIEALARRFAPEQLEAVRRKAERS